MREYSIKFPIKGVGYVDQVMQLDLGFLSLADTPPKDIDKIVCIHSQILIPILPCTKIICRQ